jgi:hypothetical protein
MSVKKHVIILGAGASLTSGYPLAAELRLILSSPENFKSHLHSKLPGVNIQRDWIPYFMNFFHELRGAIDLFRHGGFATVDEFSFLAGKRFPKEVAAIKNLVAVVLAVHNPEDNFHSTDYYPFIQRLFTADLHNFRDDLVILSYNYDPYLEYLLKKAYERRKQAAGEKPAPEMLSRLCSGLDGASDDAIRNDEGFCLLKLHGTIALPKNDRNENALAYDDIFRTHTDPLQFRISGSNDAPMYFPWEVVSHDATGINQSIFQAIWWRARREITNAKKISFVGISMHPFLETGLKYLFKQKADHIESIGDRFRQEDEALTEVVSASPESEVTDARSLLRIPESKACIRLREMLSSVCPKIQLRSSRLRESGLVTPRGSFDDFIRHEMDPLK